MKPNILTKEKLQIILHAIKKGNGQVSIRYLLKNHFIQRNIIDEAVQLEFVSLHKLSPPTGRPSLVLHKVNKSNPTKLPPSTRSLEQRISIKHWNFASHYTLGELGSGHLSFKRRAYIAYKKSYTSCLSIGSAKSASSRLLKQPHIKAAIQWEHATRDPEINTSGHHPSTATEIWNTLHLLGSFRARRAPYYIQSRWRQ